MLVLTEKLMGIVPGVYPHSCEDHWLFNMNESETSLTCTNELCPIKSSYKMKSALDLLEIRVNIGTVNSLKLVLSLGLDSHMDLFDKACHPEKVSNEAWGMYGDKLLEIGGVIEKINAEGGFSLPKYMDAWGCDVIGSTRADDIFRSWHSLEDFYAKYDTSEKLQSYIGTCLNISEYCDTVVNITKFLLANKEDILQNATNFKFKEVKIDKAFVDTPPIYVCITDSILYAKDEEGSYFSDRWKYIPYLCDKYHVNIQKSSSITRRTNYLINDEGNRKGKYRKVKENPLYKNCVITRSDILEVVLEVMSGDTSNVYTAKNNQLEEW